MHAVFHSDPPHPILQTEPIVEPVIPKLISEMNDIIYTKASNDDELLACFQSLSKRIIETEGKVRYSILIYSIKYINSKMFSIFVSSQLIEKISLILEEEVKKANKKEIDETLFLMIQRCFLPISQMIIQNNSSINNFEKSVIRVHLSKSRQILSSIHISIRLYYWISDINRDTQILQIILESLKKVPIKILPSQLTTEIARCLIIATLLLQMHSSSDLYIIRRDLVICISKILLDQPNSFANPSTIEILNYINQNEVDYKKMTVNGLCQNPFFPVEYKSKRPRASSKTVVAIPAIDALRIPEKVPLLSVIQEIRITLFSANVFDPHNLLEIGSISSSSQSAVIRNHPELFYHETEKVFFGKCLSIDTLSEFARFEKTPKDIVELATFLRSTNVAKSAFLNAMTKNLDKIVTAVYMSVKRLQRITTDVQTLISAAKIMSFFISYATYHKLVKLGVFKHNLCLSSQTKTFSSFVESFNPSDGKKGLEKKVKKLLFRENFQSLLPRSYTFISEMIADSQVMSPLFPHFVNNGSFEASCCPESLLLLSSFEELAKSLSLHPKDFLSVILNTNASPGRVKLLTIAIKNAVQCYSKTQNSMVDDIVSAKNNNVQKVQNDPADGDSDAYQRINDDLFVDDETVEVWKRMIKTNLNSVCQFGLSILKIPSEVTCKIAAEFYVTIVLFISLFISNKNGKKDKENSEQFNFSYNDLNAVLLLPMTMLINISNRLLQIEPLNNPKNAIFFLGFIERILSPMEMPDLTISSNRIVIAEDHDDFQKVSQNAKNEEITKNNLYIKTTSNVNATSIIKSFFVINGSNSFWDCLFYMMNIKLSISGPLAARAMRIMAIISDFGNTLQKRLSISQRLIIDVVHHLIVKRIIDMLNEIKIDDFSYILPHEKCLISLSLAQLLLSWCEPIPLAAFVETHISPNLINIIEKLSFSISDSIPNYTTIKRADGSVHKIMNVNQKQSLVFSNTVSEILKKVKECFESVSGQGYETDLINTQQSIPPPNIPQKLSGLFFMTLESAVHFSDESEESNKETK